MRNENMIPKSERSRFNFIEKRSKVFANATG